MCVCPARAAVVWCWVVVVAGTRDQLPLQLLHTYQHLVDDVDDDASILVQLPPSCALMFCVWSSMSDMHA